MKTIAVINGRSYRKKGDKNIKEAVSYIREKLGASVVFTDYARHAEEIARRSSGRELIIAIGGDGTVHEIVNNMDINAQVLALIPLGTGNSLTRDLGIRSARSAIGIIERGKASSIDLIKCEIKAAGNWIMRYAVTTTGLGFVSDSVIIACKYFRPLNALCYTAGAICALFTQKKVTADIEADGVSLGNVRFTGLMVNNSAYAGNFRVFPRASLNDSSLDILIADVNPFSQLLHNIGILTETYFHFSGVERKARALNVKMDRPAPFMIDGEIFDSVTELKYTVMPKRLKILC